jgi:hypothetical protein
MTEQVSAADVDANPNSWYSDGVDVYVRHYDDRAPDDDTRVQLILGHYVEGPITVYLENIDFCAGEGFRADYNLGRPTVYAKNCTFKHSHTIAGFKTNGADSYLFGCEASNNLDDGFNYHAGSGQIPRSFEIDCIGNDNGELGNDNNNGSTSHDAGIAIRLNCTYLRNFGPNCADVSGAMSFNVNVDCADSFKTSNIRNYEISQGYMYLIYCNSGGGRDFDILVTSDGMLYHYNTNLDLLSYADAEDIIQYNPFQP